MSPLLDCLTAQQERVIALLATGLDLHGVAREMGVSWETARSHRAEATRRLAARSTAHAVAMLVAAGRARP